MKNTKEGSHCKWPTCVINHGTSNSVEEKKLIYNSVLLLKKNKLCFSFRSETLLTRDNGFIPCAYKFQLVVVQLF